MIGHIANRITRAVTVAILPGTVAFVSLPPASCFAQAADAGIAPGTTVPAPDTGTPSEPRQVPPQEDTAKQPVLDPIAARIKYMHDRLRITPAQEPLWAKLAQVMRDNAKAMAPLVRERFQAAREAGAIENLNAYEKLEEAELEGLKNFTAAFQALYASMSDQQKKIADFTLRLSLANMVGTVPQLPELEVTAPLLPYNPPYESNPDDQGYAYYSYEPPYPYSYAPPFFLGFPVGLGAPFFFYHRHAGYPHAGYSHFGPFRPRMHGGIPAHGGNFMLGPWHAR